MILLWAENASRWPEDVEAKIAARMPPALAAAARRYRRWEDRQASLLGKLLLEAQVDRAGLRTSLANLRHSAHGRPWLPGTGDFNISHAGSRVICGWSNRGRIGVDVELHRPELRLADFEALLSAPEQVELNMAADPVRELIRIWTLKEAVAKAEGSGIAGAALPDCAGCSPGRPVRFGGRDWYLRGFEDAGHRIACAAEDPAALACATQLQMRLCQYARLQPVGAAVPLP